MKLGIVPVLFINTVALFAADITMQKSYEKALNYEAKVKSAYYQVEAKKEEINQAKSKLYPKLDFQASGTLRGYTINYNGLKRNEQYYSSTLSGQLPVYHPENYNIIKQSKLKYQYTKLYLKQLKQQLAFNVVDTLMLIIRAKNSLIVAKAYERANKIKYQQIKKKLEKRLANKMDLLEAKVTYERSIVKVSIESKNLELAKLKFRQITGIKDINVNSNDIESINVNLLKDNFLKQDLLSNNLEVRKSNINIDLVKKEIKLSAYGRYPKVDLSASVTKFDSLNNNTDYTDDSRVMLSVKIPIFDGGYTKSRVAQYKYLLSSAYEDLKDTQRKVVSKYEEQIVNLNNAKQNIKLYKENIKSAKVYLYSVDRGYSVGLKDLTDVEDAKAKLYEAKFKLIDSIYQYIKSYASLLNLYGRFDYHKLKRLDMVLFR